MVNAKIIISRMIRSLYTDFISWIIVSRVIPYSKKANINLHRLRECLCLTYDRCNSTKPQNAMKPENNSRDTFHLILEAKCISL